MRSKVFLEAGIFWVFFLLLGGSLGFAASNASRLKACLLPLILLLGFLLASTLWPGVGRAWGDLGRLPDGLRAFGWILWAVAIGLGIRMGTHLSRPLSGSFWAVLALASFFLVTALAGAWIQFLTLLWLLLLCRALGGASMDLLRRLSSSPPSPMPWILSTALGLALLILSTLALGMAGLCSPAGILVFLAGISLLLIRKITASFADSKGFFKGFPAPTSLVGAGALSGLIALFLLFWVAALAPEVGPDAIGLRTASPVAWLEKGGVVPLPEMMGSYGFCAGEMIYLLALPLMGASMAKLIQFALAILILVSLFGDVFPEGRRRNLALWLLPFWGSTLVWVQLAWGFVDVTQLFFYYASILALSRWLGSPREILWLVLAGTGAATATSIKLNGGGAFLILGLVVLIVGSRGKEGFPGWIRSGLALGLPAGLFLAPWLARSWYFTGNPVFPFANRFFQSPLSPPDAPTVPFGLGTDLGSLFRIPWNLVFEPQKFVEIGTYHPALLALAPLSLLGLSRIGSPKALWGLAAGLAGLAWALTCQNARYSLFAVLFFSIILTVGFSALEDLPKGVPKRLVFGSILVLVLFGLGMQLCRPASWLFRSISGPGLPTRVVLGGLDRGAYLGEVLPTFYCARWLNRHWGSEARVWQLLGVRDHLYFQSRATSLYHGILPVTSPLVDILRREEFQSDPGAIHRRLVGLGYTHLMYFNQDPILSNLPEGERKGVFSRDFARGFLELRLAHRGMRLFRILSEERTAQGPASAYGPNLLDNPRLEVGGGPRRVPSWEVEGEVDVKNQGSERFLRLWEGGGIRQAIDVEGGGLAGFGLEARLPGRDAGLTIKVDWLDRTGKTLLYWQHRLSRKGIRGEFEFFQTIPESATRAILSLRGGEALVKDVQFRAIPAGKGNGRRKKAR